jgi:anaerobic selenocysteine-containing dehydrogenase
MPHTQSSVHSSICRFCHAHCGIQVVVEDGRAVKVFGDKDNPVYHGFSCAKGRSLPAQHAHPERLLAPHKRLPDGSHRPIPSAQALDEIAERVQRIVARHGPRSVALYLGTYSFPYPASSPLATSWMLALGSRMIFTSATIDQPGKPIAQALHGRWNAGGYAFDDCDLWMLIGVNPLVAMSNGVPNSNPARRLRRARQRGLQLIAIDPRYTETAREADLYLQPRPGEDPAILAGMIRVVTREGLHDAAFVAEHATGFEALCEAVEPFTPEYLARRADVPAGQLIEAARAFATARRAGATAGTGPNMAGRGNLTEYLLLALHTICGHWPRAGERFANPIALLPPFAPRAQPEPPQRAWGYGEKLRVRGLTDAACGLPTAALADEILMPGDGQVRALFCVGGNPVGAWPDQLKTIAALESLELLVTTDIKMSATARLAHYVIAPRLCLEVPGLSLANESLWFYGLGLGYPEPYAQYAPALVEPPPGSDVMEDWELFYGLAQRMGLQLRLRIANAWDALGGPPKIVELDMQNKPTTDELFYHFTAGSRVPLDEVKRHPHGAIFLGEPTRVAPRDPECSARLDIGNPVMLAELREVAGEALDRAPAFGFRLVSRRMPDVYNSSGRDIPRLVRRRRHNPAFMNPADLQELGLRSGDVIEIRSDHASILGVVEAEAGLKRGVISMSHSFGDAPQYDAQLRRIGSNTGRLTSVERDYDPYTGIPRMSAIPVNVRRFEGELTA